MNYIRLKAYGKINLSLDITGRRPNGYHDVRMIMQTVDMYDTIYVKKLKTPSIEIKTNLPYLPTGDSNIAYKAAELMRQEYGIHEGLLIDINKFIPVAAGMAGGSTDAAAVLIAMNKLFDLGCDTDKLKELGLKLGADVPFCITGGTYLSEGIGEILTPLMAPPACHLLIVKPQISASTKVIYEKYDSIERTYHPDVDGMINAINSQDVYDIAAKLGNVLEEVTSEEYPVIKRIKQTILDGGAIGSIMTGSGPTVFGLFDDESKIEPLVNLLKNDPEVRRAYHTGFINF